MRGSLLFALLFFSSALFFGSAATLGQPDTSAPMPFDVSDHRWTHRLLLVFAPSDEHPDLLAQRQMATGFAAGFRDRDLLFVSVLERGDSLADNRPMDEASAEKLRERYDVEPGEFAVILIGKDGTKKRRSDRPVSIEALFEQIDQMPMRQRELQQRNQR
jgi:hypothetical protein